MPCSIKLVISTSIYLTTLEKNKRIWKNSRHPCSLMVAVSPEIRYGEANTGLLFLSAEKIMKFNIPDVPSAITTCLGARFQWPLTVQCTAISFTSRSFALVTFRAEQTYVFPCLVLFSKMFSITWFVCLHSIPIHGDTDKVHIQTEFEITLWSTQLNIPI